MRSVTDEFVRTITGSHRVAVKALAVAAGQEGAEPVGIELEVISGKVSMAYDADIRAMLDITVRVTSDVAWPIASTDPLDPSGSEIVVYRGVDYGGGRTELVGLGYFRIDDDEQDIPVDMPIRITATDRMGGIIDARFEEPRYYNTTWTYGDAIEDLVHDVYPAATVEWDDATSSTHLGSLVIQDEDRHAMLMDLVTAVGKICYWDYRGILLVRDPPSDEPVGELKSGRDGTLVSLNRKLSRVGAVNIIVATGESADERPAVRGVARDDNPASRTYYAGPFGPVPDFYSSPLLTTDSMCIKAARTILGKRLGLLYNVNFGSVPNPANEPGDVLTVTYDRDAGSEIHRIDTLEIGLGANEAMTGAMRQRALTAGGGGA